MRILTSLSLASAMACSLHLSAAAAPRGGEACAAAAKANAASVQSIDLVICLDTSGSMSGLIDAARAKIWDIVSDLARATPTPKLRVALLQFGNDGLSPENGWTNIETDLTDNLDVVSQKLFSLTTNGGTELVGRVVDRATTGLSWGASEDTLRILVVAGNESADQDQQMRYPDVCKRAIERMILVNSIYCGAPTDEVAPGWKEVATLADGHFATIDQNNGTVVVATPFDEELVALSAKLNTTYLGYGSAGAWNAGNQVTQDFNAQSISGAVAAQRCVTKGGALYDNRGWDLVDACKESSFNLAEVKDEDLPEEMRGKSLEEKQAIVASRGRERDELQKRVQELGDRRTKFVADEIAKRAGADASAFDRAIRDAIRAQATARGFAFPPEPATAAQPAPEANGTTAPPSAG